MFRNSGWLSIILIVVALGCGNNSRVQEELDAIGHIGLWTLPTTEVIFYSEAVQRDMAINVMLPRGYEESNARYPVLYFCHGLTSNYQEFKYIGVPEYLNNYDMIVVTVDVGNSWYVNWAESADGKPYNFADHITQDIIGYVDSHFRTVADRRGRAINGISMGGFGPCRWDCLILNYFARLPVQAALWVMPPGSVPASRKVNLPG